MKRIQRMEDLFEEKSLEIRLVLLDYDPKFPPADPIILKPALHVKPCPIWAQFGRKAVDCPELRPLSVKTVDCIHIRAGPE
jgi:hypothetical protein